MKSNLYNLEVYSLAYLISKEAWSIYKNLPNHIQYATGNQLLRSADSISANIAEGYGRYHYRESIQFNYYARGSAYETIDWVSKLKDRNYVQIEKYEAISKLINDLILKLNGYIKFLRSKSSK